MNDINVAGGCVFFDCEMSWVLLRSVQDINVIVMLGVGGFFVQVGFCYI